MPNLRSYLHWYQILSEMQTTFCHLTIDFAIAFAGVVVLLENKNLVFLGTSTEKGYDPLPFATGTWDSQISLINKRSNKWEIKWPKISSTKNIKKKAETKKWKVKRQKECKPYNKTLSKTKRCINIQ